MTEDRLEARHVKAVATFGTRDTAEWRCECGAAWPCDAMVLREAGARLAAALLQAMGIAHRSQHDHNTPVRECRRGDNPGTGTRCGDWSAALAAWKEVTGG